MYGGGHLEHFDSLPAERQNTIINAALTAFGRNGYKKASVHDIASAAGISKAMVFYYFGSKKSLYLHLVHVCLDIVIDEVNRNLDRSVTDFFDRIIQATEIKISAIKRHPAILMFLKRMHDETDPEVASELQKIATESDALRKQLALDETDASKFKDDVDPVLVLKFLIWASEGFSAGLSLDTSADQIDAFVKEFFTCLRFMRNNFYKKEYV